MGLELPYVNVGCWAFSTAFLKRSAFVQFKLKVINVVMLSVSLLLCERQNCYKPRLRINRVLKANGFVKEKVLDHAVW